MSRDPTPAIHADAMSDIAWSMPAQGDVLGSQYMGNDREGIIFWAQSVRGETATSPTTTLAITEDDFKLPKVSSSLPNTTPTLAARRRMPLSFRAPFQLSSQNPAPPSLSTHFSGPNSDSGSSYEGAARAYPLESLTAATTPSTSTSLASISTAPTDQSTHESSSSPTPTNPEESAALKAFNTVLRAWLSPHKPFNRLTSNLTAALDPNSKPTNSPTSTTPVSANIKTPRAQSKSRAIYPYDYDDAREYSHVHARARVFGLHDEDHTGRHAPHHERRGRVLKHHEQRGRRLERGRSRSKDS